MIAFLIYIVIATIVYYYYFQYAKKHDLHEPYTGSAEDNQRFWSIIFGVAWPLSIPVLLTLLILTKIHKNK